MKKRIESFYEKKSKEVKIIENYRKNKKISQDNLEKSWNLEKIDDFILFVESERLCEIIKKTNLLLSCENLKKNNEKILEVINLIEDEYYENELKIDEILFEKIFELLAISSLVFEKNLEKMIAVFNNIVLNYIKKLILIENYQEINKIIESYFLVKLEIIYELDRKEIFSSKDQYIYLEIISKIPIDKIDKVVLDIGVLFNNIGLFKLDRFSLFVISKQIMKVTKEEFSFDEYSDAVYIYEKNRCKSTFTRKALDWYCGYGEHPFNILKMGFAINVVFLFIYFFNYRNLFQLNNIAYNDSKIKLFIDILYFNVTTIITVGYGDIYPLNSLTKILVMCQQILGFIFTTSFVTLFLRKLFRY